MADTLEADGWVAARDVEAAPLEVEDALSAAADAAMFEAVFEERRLGIKLVLARDDGGRTAVVVDETIGGVCPDDVFPRDELVAIDGEGFFLPTPATFSTFITKLAKRPRPLTLKLRRGAGREGALAAQTKRHERARSKAALEHYEKREEDGRAAYNAALLKGKGVHGEKDTAAALLLLRKAAGLGVVRAQTALASLYLTGRGGVARDDDEAFRWFSEAAQRGDTEALYQLGKCHRNGFGVAADDHAALWCWTRAANDGHARARDQAKRLIADGEAASRRESMLRSVRDALFPPKKDDAAYEELESPCLGVHAALQPEDDDELDLRPGYAPPAPPAAPLAVPPTPPAVFRGRKPRSEPAATTNPFLDEVAC